MVKHLVGLGADLEVPGQLGGLTGVPLEWGKELCRINVIERENQFRIIQDRGE